MGTTLSPSTRSPRFAWLLLGAVAIGLVLLAAWRSMRMSGDMSAAASASQDLEQAKPGTISKAVVEIGEVSSDGTIVGRILKPKSEEMYSRTTALVRVRSDSQTKIVMGKSSDAHAGAVIYITGRVQSDHSLEAQQIVILTGYVKVE
jgi:hypothetical protein